MMIHFVVVVLSVQCRHRFHPFKCSVLMVEAMMVLGPSVVMKHTKVLKLLFE